MDEASDFKFGTLLEFSKAHQQIPPEEKVDVALGYRSFPNFGVSPLIFLQRLKLYSDFKFSTHLVFAKAYHKITPKEKTGRGLGLKKFPKSLDSPIRFLHQL